MVHDLHGVGLYKGVVQMDNDGAKRDYLLIHYAVCVAHVPVVSLTA